MPVKEVHLNFRIGHSDSGKVAFDFPPDFACGVQAMQPSDARRLAAAILKSCFLAEGRVVPRIATVVLER